MKKFNKVIYLVFFFCSVFFCATTVNARSGTDLCKYSNGDERTAWVYYDSGRGIRVEYIQSDVGGDSGDKSINNDLVYFSSYALNDLTQTGKCPESIYIDINGKNELCFDNGGGYCTDTKDFAKSERAKLKTDYFEDTMGYLKAEGSVRIDFSNKSCAVYSEDQTVLNSLFMDEIRDKVSALTKQYPAQYSARIEAAINDIFTKELNSGPYESFKNRCETEFKTQVENGTMSSEEAEEKIQMLNNVDLEAIKDEVGRLIINSFENTYTGRIFCGIFGEKTFGFIKSMYTVVKILIPVLIIVLGIIDFLKVVFSGEDKDMKASGTRFLKRIIAGIIFILLPALLEFLMSIVGFSEDCLQQLIK